MGEKRSPFIRRESAANAKRRQPDMPGATVLHSAKASPATPLPRSGFVQHASCRWCCLANVSASASTLHAGDLSVHHLYYLHNSRCADIPHLTDERRAIDRI